MAMGDECLYPTDTESGYSYEGGKVPRQKSKRRYSWLADVIAPV